MQVIEIGFRIKQAIGLSGYSVSTFCEKTGRSRSSLGILISGRGGLPKNDFIESICIDLKMFDVECSSSWIMKGKGIPPHLKDAKKSSIPSQKKSDTASRMIAILQNYLETLEYTNIFDIITKDLYIICKKVSSNHVKRKCLSKEMYIESLAFNLKGLVTVIDYCQDTEHFIIKSKSRHLCVSKDKIDKIGEVVVKLNKR